MSEEKYKPSVQSKKICVPKQLLRDVVKLKADGMTAKEALKIIADKIGMKYGSLDQAFYAYRYHVVLEAIERGHMGLNEMPERATHAWVKKTALDLIAMDKSLDHTKARHDNSNVAVEDVVQVAHTDTALETLSITWIVSQVRALYEDEPNGRNKLAMLQFLTNIADRYNEELRNDLTAIKGASLRELLDMMASLLNEMGHNEFLVNTLKVMLDNFVPPETIVRATMGSANETAG